MRRTAFIIFLLALVDVFGQGGGGIGPIQGGGTGGGGNVTIAPGTITDAMVATNAGIAQSKIALGPTLSILNSTSPFVLSLTTAPTATAFKGLLALTPADVNLPLVDNTSDLNKPLSTAAINALAAKADSTSVTAALALKVDLTTYNSGLAGKENAAGNPPADGYIWSSTATGSRSWIPIPGITPTDIGARVYNSADVSINNNTITALPMDSERFDTDTIHSTTSNTARLVCHTPGKYIITGHVIFAANGTGFRQVLIRYNGTGGTSFIASELHNAVSGTATQASVTTVYDLAANDYLELCVVQTSTAALNVSAVGNYSPEFSMQRINGMGVGGGGGGGSGSLTDFHVTNNVSTLFNTTVTNSTTTPVVTIDPVSQLANSWYGNATAFSGNATFNTSPFPAALMPAFTGDVTSSAGSVALSIPTGSVGLNKLASMASGNFVGRVTSGSGSPEVLNPSQTRAILGLNVGVDVQPYNASTTILGNTATGTGALVEQTSPTINNAILNSPNITTPTLGIATATSINKISITAPSTGATLTLANGVTFSATSTMTLTGTNGATLNIGPGGTIQTVAYTGAAADLSGNVPNAKLATMPANTVKANLTAGVATPTDATALPEAMVTNLVADLASKANGDIVQTVHNSDATITPGTTKVLYDTTFTAAHLAHLPAASGYQTGGTVRLIDLKGVTTSTNKLTVDAPAGSDKLNNVTHGSIDVGKGGVFDATFTSDGIGAWSLNQIPITSIQNYQQTTLSLPNPGQDALVGWNAALTPQAGFDWFGFGAGLAVVGTSPNKVLTVNLPNSTPVTDQFLRAYGPSGAITDFVHARQLRFDVAHIGAPDITTGTYVTIADGSVDQGRLEVALTTALTVVIPPPNVYDDGEPFTFYDAFGAASAATPINLVAPSGYTIDNGGSITLTEPFGSVVFRSSGGGSTNWQCNLPRTRNAGTQVINPVGNSFTITTDPNTFRTTSELHLLNGNNNILVPSPVDNMEYVFILKQPASGSAATITLPVGSAAPGGGTIALTGTNGHIDKLRTTYNGNDQTFYWDSPTLDELKQAVPAAPSALGLTPTSTTVALAWTDNASNESGFEVAKSTDGGTTYSTITNSVAANATSYTDSSVAPSTTYFYKVRAFNSGGFSAYSTAASTTTSAGAPTADILEWHLNQTGTDTSALATVGLNGTANRASWTTSTQSGTGGAYHALLSLTKTNGVVATATNPTSGTTAYQYKIVANDAGGFHNNASTASVSVNNAASLGGAPPNNSYNAITWNATSGAVSYDVWRTTGAPTGKIATVTTTSYNDTSSTVITSGSPSNTNTSPYKIQATSSVAYNTPVVTMSLWVNLGSGLSNAGASPVVMTLDSGNLNATNVYYTNAATPRLGVFMPGSTSGALEQQFSITGLTDSNWHHVVVIADRTTGTGTITVYVDGSAVSAASTITNTLAGNANFPNGSGGIGSANGGAVADMDDFRIYSSALNSTQVTALFSAGAK